MARLLVNIMRRVCGDASAFVRLFLSRCLRMVCSLPKVGVGRRDVFQALVVTLVVIMLDERFDLGFEVAGQEVVFQEDAVLQGLVPAFDLTLCLGMERRTADMAHVLRRDIAGPIIAEQPWLVLYCCAPAAHHLSQRLKINIYASKLEASSTNCGRELELGMLSPCLSGVTPGR